MKSRIFHPVVVFHIFFVANVFAQIPRTVDEAKKMSLTSNLAQIAEIQGVTEKDLGVDAIRKILTQHEGSLIGDISDVSKFATLKDLCSKIEALPDRDKLGKELFKLFKKLNVVEGEPKNWNEVLVKGEGGSLGLITKCLLASSGKNIQSKVLDYLLEEDQLAKAKLFLEKARFEGDKEEFKILLGQKIEAAKSDEMKGLLLLFTEKTPSK